MAKKWVNNLITERLQLAKENCWEDEVKELEALIVKREQRRIVKAAKFDSEGFIKEMETLDSVEDIPLDCEDYEKEQEQITEREIKGDL